MITIIIPEWVFWLIFIMTAISAVLNFYLARLTREGTRLERSIRDNLVKLIELGDDDE